VSHDSRRILLYLLLPIGDTLFATPTIRALRLCYPHARIAAIAYPTNAGILEANPDIDRIYLHPTSSTWKGWRAYARFLWRLNRGKYDLAVQFGPAQWWLTQIVRPAQYRRLKVPVWQWFVPFGPRPWRNRHAMASYASLLTAEELAHLPASAVLVSSEADRQAALIALPPQVGERLVALHPGGEGFRGMKRWPLARFIGLAHGLTKQHGVRVVVLGGADEVTIAAALARAVPGATSLAGVLNLGQTMAVLERCELFVGNDSAPMHMAAALGVPTVGIFGPTSVANFRPLGARVTIVRAGLACSPCFHFVGSHPVWAGSRCAVPSCLHAVSTHAVVSAANSYLRAGRREENQA
jgi:ADP-heptose:LPS heptosyltransferase